MVGGRFEFRGKVPCESATRRGIAKEMATRGRIVLSADNASVHRREARG